MKVWRTLAIVPLATLMLAGPAAAYQDENDGTNPRVVSPEECVAEPRATDQIAGLLGLAGEGITPPALPTITAPLGQNMSSDASVSVKEAVREILACFNAGDIARASTLMTDNGVIRTYWQLTEPPELRQTAQERIGTAVPRPEPAQIRLVTVTDISILPSSSTTRSLWMPGFSVKKRSARPMGSLPNSRSWMVRTSGRGVSASETFRRA